MKTTEGSPDKGTAFYETRSLQCGTRLLSLSTPVVMGIINLTPDSFYDGGKSGSIDQVLRRAGQMIEEGAAILDLGAVSTRPGAAEVSESEEKARLYPAFSAIADRFPEIILSADTFRASVARDCCAMGAGIINDISGGSADSGMLPLMSEEKAAWVLMHMQGTPQTMQDNPQYNEVGVDIADFFAAQLSQKALNGKQNIILDPGFGFGKSLNDNFRLLNYLDAFLTFGLPLMAGISRKSMIYKTLNCTPDQALNGTSVLNTIALLRGASILRVHDVAEAVETIKLVDALNRQSVIR